MSDEFDDESPKAMDLHAEAEEEREAEFGRRHWRYHFAGLALQGILAGDVRNELTRDSVIDAAIEMADELLEALEDAEFCTDCALIDDEAQ